VAGDGSASPGAPVFLWPVAESARRSLAGPRQVVADTAGKYRFDSLPPGDYRVFASFDFSGVDLENFDEAQAPVFTVQAGQTAAADLRLWAAP
jgi:hypothetical protein